MPPALKLQHACFNADGRTNLCCCSYLIRYWQEVSFMPIEKLASMGVNAGDIKKAKDAGFHTINCLLMNTKKVRVLLMNDYGNIYCVLGNNDYYALLTLSCCRLIFCKPSCFLFGIRYQPNSLIISITTDPSYYYHMVCLWLYLQYMLPHTSIRIGRHTTYGTVMHNEHQDMSRNNVNAW